MLNILGCKINVLDQGQGPPVLLLHGNPDSSTAWTGVIDFLAPHFRCIAPDLPGFGRSTAPSNFDYTLNGLAAFVDALHSALGFTEPINVVAHDVGGTFATAWVCNFPNKVRRLALMNTTFTTKYPWHFWAHVWRTPLLGELSMQLMNKPLFEHELRRGSPGIPSGYIDDAYRSVTPSSKKTVLRLYRSVRRHSLAGWENRFRMAAQDVPVLVIWGEGDPYIPNAFADQLHARKVVRYPAAGHWPQVVEPERVASELSAFFAP